MSVHASYLITAVAGAVAGAVVGVGVGVSGQVAKKLWGRQEELEHRQREIANFRAEASQVAAKLQEAVHQVNQNLSLAQEIQRETNNELEALSQHVEVAQQTLRKSEYAHSQNREDVRELSTALERGEALRSQLESKTAELEQLEQELNFLTQDADLLLPNLMTLMAMQSNGYVLRQTISEEGLIAYFESADSKHQIAVSHRKRSSFEAQWEMEAETFQLADEMCLEVLEDFALGVEETELVEMELVSRHYPKRDGQTAIPVPLSPTADVQRSKRRRRVTSG